MTDRHCEIDGRHIPILLEDRQGRARSAATRRFSGGENGPHEAGVYAFWAVLAGPVALLVFRTVDGHSVEGRLLAHTTMTPRQLELLQKFADRLMPATDDEIKMWLDTHPKLAAFLVAQDGESPATDRRVR